MKGSVERIRRHDGTAEGAASFFDAPGHRESVVRGIVHGVLPLKYAYAGSAAYTHDRLAHEEGYQSVIGAVAHEAEVITAAGVEKDLTRIVEVGPGNGNHSLQLLSRLRASGENLGSYLGLDFSRTLLTLFQRNVEGRVPGLSLGFDIWDVEAGASDVIIEQWRKDNGGGIVVLFLGNTVGNVEDPVAVLRNIYESVRFGDTIIVGATLRGPDADADKALQPYLTDVFAAAALEPLIAAGIDADALDFWPDYRDGVVIGFATVRRSVSLDGVCLEEGKTIRCFASKRFTADGIESMIREAGWRVGKTSVDSAAEHIVVAATKG
jgi:L-histidine Nalpha-methyltransferase